MRIKSLRLKDFRAFHKFEIIDLGKHENTNIVDNKNSIDIEIKFPDSNLTVFIGENGSGKTSILDALAILLTKIFNTAPNKSSQALISKRNSKFITGLSSYELKESDIYFEKDKNISVTKIELLLDNNENGLFNWILKGYKDGDNFIEATEEIELEKGHNTHYSLISSIRYNLERNHNYANLPIFCFYQTNSSIYEKDNNNKPKISLNKDFPSQFFAYRNSFSKDSYSFEEFIKWFRVNEEKENKTVKEKE
nr:AAA family ATPase [Leptospiraceae bacterium]